MHAYHINSAQNIRWWQLHETISAKHMVQNRVKRIYRLVWHGMLFHWILRRLGFVRCSWNLQWMQFDNISCGFHYAMKLSQWHFPLHLIFCWLTVCLIVTSLIKSLGYPLQLGRQVDKKFFYRVMALAVSDS